MKVRATNLVFIVIAAFALGLGAYLLSTSVTGLGARAATSAPGGEGGNNPRPKPSSSGQPSAPVKGEGEDARTAPHPAAYTDALVDRGAEVYAAHCQVCHGGSGAGNGPWSTIDMQVRPRSFTDANWMSSQSDGVFYTSIQRGVPGSAMPAFADRLGERDIWAAVAYIRGFSPKVTLDPQMDPGELDPLGKDLYEANCAGCHGATGDGDGEAAKNLVTPPRRLSNSDWLNAKSESELVGTINQGLPGTAMPGFGAELTATESQAIARYLRTLAGAPEQLNPDQGGWAQETYRAYCASCHGVDGDGQGVAAGRIDPKPRDFRNPRWMAGQSTSSLADVIGTGRPGTAMPPFAALLTQDERELLATYLRSFAGPEAMPGSGSAYRYSPPASPSPTK